MKRSFSFNAPFTLIFTFLCILVTLICLSFPKSARDVLCNFFSPPLSQGTNAAFNWKNFSHYFRLFLHIFRHTDWTSLSANLTFVLLLAPQIEDRYGKCVLLLMCSVSALVSGVISACFLTRIICGADGIVFLLIFLSLFSSGGKSEIPLTFVLAAVLYLLQEIFTSKDIKSLAILAHLSGGLCASLFAFLPDTEKVKRKKKNSKNSNNPDGTEYVGEVKL